MSDASIPAAWYPDPAGSAAHRWWDGVQWTEHLREVEPPQHPVVYMESQAVAPQPVANHYVPMAPYGSTVADPYVPMAAFHPSATAAGGKYDYSVPLPAYTTAGWWLALSPVWIITVQALMQLVLVAPAPLRAVVSLGILFASAALTMHDRKVLLRSGHSTAASTWWWLLTPLAYLIARSVHVGRQGLNSWALPITYFGSGFVSFAVLVALVFALLPSMLQP